MPTDKPQFISDIGQTFENGKALMGVRFVCDQANEMLFVQECLLLHNYKTKPNEAAEFQEDGWQEEARWGVSSAESIEKAKELIKTGDYKPETTMPNWAVPKVEMTFATAIFEVAFPDGRVFYLKTERACQMEDVDEVATIHMDKPKKRKVKEDSKEWVEVIAAWISSGGDDD